jgi:serine protease AprX
MKLFFSLIIICMAECLHAQTSPGKYWVRFADKNNSPYSLANPTAFLSDKCVARRLQFNLGFDQKDIPVNENYINQVLATGNCTLHNKSKWFNAITIATEDTALIETIALLPFVAEVRSVPVLQHNEQKVEKLLDVVLTKKSNAAAEITTSNQSELYGPSFRQIEMLNGHLLHELGYNGQGVDIAVLDAGWSRTNILPAFDALRSEGRLKQTKDFVYTNDNNVYYASNHGTYVLSLMAGSIADSLLGTAPAANYFLFRTENPDSEYITEEDNWVAAAELCDSLGIDIINSSLGYSLFDDSNMNHSYADMDGNTTRCSIAADIAAQKGILVVNSAGNSGDNPWHYITAPSDGDSVLCVGATRADGTHAFFSSFGPSSDGQVKPNVSAMGFACVIADMDSTIRTGNGTSFSSPIIAGMAACLKQAFPNKNNIQLLRAIEQSAHLYNTPNDSLGNGIPDFWKAFLILQGNNMESAGELNATAFPNPCHDYLNVVIEDENACNVHYTVYDLLGKKTFESSAFLQSGAVGVLQLNQAIKTLANGIYLLKLSVDTKQTTLRFEVLRN